LAGYTLPVRCSILTNQVRRIYYNSGDVSTLRQAIYKDVFRPHLICMY